MIAPDRTTDTLANHQSHVAAALRAIAGPDAFAMMRALEQQPRLPGDLAVRLGVWGPEEVWDMAVPLVAGGLIESWGGGWKLTALGAELWGAIEHIVERG